MTTESTTYLATLHQLVNESYNLAELRTLCMSLHIDYESVPGEEKPSRIRELLLGMARRGRLPELLKLLQEERPGYEWPPLPDDFSLPESLASGTMVVPANQYHVYGDVVHGDKVAGDKITVGNVSDGSVVAVGKGATAIYQAGLSIEEVAKLVVELKNEDQPEVWDGRNPYLGLNSFRESDAEFFFGREELVEELLDRVQQARFIVIAGPSGSGKSSVARAGLFHALRNGRIDRSDKWLLSTMKPKGDPIEGLAAALARTAKSPAIADTIRKDGVQNPETLHQLAEILLTDDPRERLVLLVDQFEETFTQTRDEAVRSAFIALLTTAAQKENGRVIVILSLRSDFISQCARYPELRSYLSEQFQLVGAMDPQDLAKAITMPAMKVGAEIDPHLVSQIMADMKGEPGALPLMSFALHTLFEAEKTEKGKAVDLTLEEYLNRGGLESALERHANKVFDTFSDEKKLLTKNIFSKLIEVGLDQVVTRRTVVIADLVSTKTSGEAIVEIVNILAQETVRLLTTSGIDANNDANADLPMEATVTIAHEKLIEAWPWLRQLVEENREIIAMQNRIHNDAIVWQQHEDDGYLYRGGRLLQVQENWELLSPLLSPTSHQFIQASEDEQKRIASEAEKQRRISEELRLQQQMKRVVQASKLAYASQSLLTKNPELALLLAVTALGIHDQPEIRYALYKALLTPYRRTIYGHLDSVSSITCSTDGETILTTSWDGTARVWGVDGYEIATLWEEKSMIYLAVFSPDRQQILTVSDDYMARIWDIDPDKENIVLTGHEDVINSAVFNADGKHILTASQDNTVRVWDLTGKEIISIKAQEGGVISALFSPDGRHVLTLGGDNIASLWELAGNKLWSIDSVRLIAFSPDPDDEHILLVTDDNKVGLWDMVGNETVTFEGHKDVIRSTAFSPDGQYILAVSDDSTVSVWDVTGDSLATLKGHTGWLRSATFNKYGEQILTLGEDNTVRLWDIDGNELAILVGHEGNIRSAIFNSDGYYIFTSGDDKTVKVWDVASNIFVEYISPVRSSIFSPDGQKILTTSWSYSFLWDVSGPMLATLEGHEGGIKSGVFSPDGEHVLTAGDDKTARLWDLAGNEIGIFEGHEGGLNSAIFSPDGQMILTASQDWTARLWDANGNLRVIFKEHTDSTYSAVFSPDGQKVLTSGYDERVLLWNLEGNEFVALPINAYSASFSPDGQKILAFNSDNTVKVLDMVSNDIVILEGHEDAVESAVFSPDGQLILTAGRDRTIRLWDLAGNALAIMEGHKEWVYSAVFRPDGRMILSASFDKTVRVWPVFATIEGMVEVAKQRLSRGFSEKEMARYFRDDPESCPRTVEELFALFGDG